MVLLLEALSVNLNLVPFFPVLCILGTKFLWSIVVLRHEQYADAVPIKLRLTCSQLTIKETDTAYNMSNLYLQILQEPPYMYSVFQDFKEIKYNYCHCTV